MKKWMLIILTIVIIIIIWQLVAIYQTAMSPIRENEKEVSQIAQQQKGLHTITNFYNYNGTSSYTIIVGLNEDNEEHILWFNDKKEIVLSKPAKEGIAKEDVLNFLDTDRTPKKIISVSLAMEDEEPLWEIKFKDENDRYNLYYIEFENGVYYQRITF
ncbi:cell wall elongation regulator TseB-like domain-containing protein [Sutcliffiella deserti]|uniref:cell wall elongation regulator TseB-like domain-containing protein n=1 Tax=Sutcliffiella deserti TaxID=2875501 RepID=UPI001CBDE629|nr:DUF5590 domain-containing protein [Sutcliffiella deserti]